MQRWYSRGSPSKEGILPQAPNFWCKTASGRKLLSPYTVPYTPLVYLAGVSPDADFYYQPEMEFPTPGSKAPGHK
jgi:hypothetical protein